MRENRGLFPTIECWLINLEEVVDWKIAILNHQWTDLSIDIKSDGQNWVRGSLYA